MVILSQNKKNLALFDSGTIQVTDSEIYYIGNGAKVMLGRYYDSKLNQGEIDKIKKIVHEIYEAKINQKRYYDMPK